MRRQTATTSGVSVSTPLVLDDNKPYFVASVAVIVTGLATYTVEHTFDDVWATGFNPATATWFPNSDAALVGATTNQDGNYIAPITACRVNQTAGAGSTRLVLIQGGV